MSWFQFIAAISWPFIALVALIILGPGGVLKKAIGELASTLLSVKSSVDEFRVISKEFNERQRS
ncbi:MAG: hypothetical protein RLY97_339, partial [Pseudomonadota bacterium]